MSNIFETINQDAEELVKKYSFFELKLAQAGMEDLSEYDKQVLETAIKIHSDKLKRKLNEQSR